MIAFLRNLFRSATSAVETKSQVGFTNDDIKQIGRCARLVDVVNESLVIANESKNLETRRSRLSVAQAKLDELKELTRKFPFLRLTTLSEVELTITRLAFQIDQEQFGKLARGNQEGQRLEADGSIDAAIKVYESLATEGADTPHTYRRLAILCRKRKQPEDETRVLKLALIHIPKSNAAHYDWFKQRLRSLKS